MGAEVMLDPLRFKQVLANLLSNAIKFTRRGRILVSLQAAPADGAVLREVEVWNLAPKHRENVSGVYAAQAPAEPIEQ